MVKKTLQCCRTVAPGIGRSLLQLTLVTPMHCSPEKEMSPMHQCILHVTEVACCRHQCPRNCCLARCIDPPHHRPHIAIAHMALRSSSGCIASSSGQCSTHSCWQVQASPSWPAWHSTRRRCQGHTALRQLQQQAALGRRSMLLSVAPPLMLLGSDDPTTIANSILSAYGLPTFAASAGYKFFDEMESDYVFEYPRSWVARPNSLRSGIIISDFQTADKLAVEQIQVSATPKDSDVVHAAVAAAVVPGGAQQQSNRLELPSEQLIKVHEEIHDGQSYTYLSFPSETITRSGYQVRRQHFAVATVKRGQLYTLSASARSDQYNEAKQQTLQHVVDSFRVR